MWSEAKQLRAETAAYYHKAGEMFCAQRFGNQLGAFVGQVRRDQKKQEVLFLCIGSDRSTGDSLGPLVGYKLEQAAGRAGVLLGTLARPVHAVNLEETMEQIRFCYPRHVVVAVDASIGRREHIGYITMGLGSLKPGLGVRKDLGAVGDIFITGIVGSGGAWEPLLLQNTRLSVVMTLADSICAGICACPA